MKLQDTKTERFLAGKGFYLVLAVCLVAVGAAAWIAVSSLSKPPLDLIDNGSAPSDSVSREESDRADAPLEDVSDSRGEAQPSSEPAPASEPESAVDANTTPAANFFVLPVTGEISKKYSDTELLYSETYKDLRLHAGIDIACETKAAIKAAGDGVVREVVDDPLWGMTVVIDHGNGILGRYCGLNQKPTVKKGDTVTAGTQIGSVGEIPCECLDPSHLHLSFTKDGTDVSPLELMGLTQ